MSNENCFSMLTHLNKNPFESANAALGESKHELVMIKANLNATTAELARGADAVSIFCPMIMLRAKS